MGFDRRGFYYRSVRNGDQVRRVYIGKGPAAQLAALLVEERRSERRTKFQAWQAREAALAGPQGRLRELDALTERTSRAALLTAGYYQHDRGAWRKRRMDGDGATNGKHEGPGRIQGDGAVPIRDEGPGLKIGAAVDGADPGDRPFSEGELRELLGRATQGDRTVLPALRRLLDAGPALWQHCGDVARVAEAAWVDLIAGRDLLVRESLTRSVATLKAELAGPAAPPLERLLAERVACCWMQAAHADAAFAGLKGGQDVTAGQFDLLGRRQERTARSYLAAIKALATVRRLAVAASPAVDLGAKTGKKRPRPGCSDGGRMERIGSSATAGGQVFRGDRKQAGKGQEARRETAVPKALRDRMKGLVGAGN